MPIKEASEKLGLSSYELRQGIHEGRYPGYWTRNHKRLLVDPVIIEECVREVMAKAQQMAKDAYQEISTNRRY